MPSTVTAVSANHYSPASATPPPASAAAANAAGGATAAQPSAASSAASNARQQAALTQLLTMYTHEQAQGVDAKSLSALGQQIMAAAKALGKQVTLPRAPASSATTSVGPATNAGPQTGKVNVTA
jgi:hypothetical protein